MSQPQLKQFTRPLGAAQHLGEGTTFVLLMKTIFQTQDLATPILFQLEYKTWAQSWQGVSPSYLTRWRCFILLLLNSRRTDFECLSARRHLWNHLHTSLLKKLSELWTRRIISHFRSWFLYYYFYPPPPAISFEPLWVQRSSVSCS